MHSGKSAFKVLREEHGFSASALARRLSVYPATVAGWDKGAVPAGNRLVVLAELFNTSPAYILRVIAASRNGAAA